MTEHVMLSDEQLERLADLIAARLNAPADAAADADGLVDAAALARILGVSRQYVYEHSAELGAVKIGTGAKPRLRFDVAEARAALTHHKLGPKPTAPAAPSPARRQPRSRLPKPGSVLKVRS